MSKCIIDGCEDKPVYGRITDYKRIYCRNHKKTEINLIDISQKNMYCYKCKIKYGFYFEKDNIKIRYCSSCREPSMINIREKK